MFLLCNAWQFSLYAPALKYPTTVVYCKRRGRSDLASLINLYRRDVLQWQLHYHTRTLTKDAYATIHVCATAVPTCLTAFDTRPMLSLSALHRSTTSLRMNSTLSPGSKVCCTLAMYFSSVMCCVSDCTVIGWNLCFTTDAQYNDNNLSSSSQHSAVQSN